MVLAMRMRVDDEIKIKIKSIRRGWAGGVKRKLSHPLILSTKGGGG
jgi:hypothetical protein